MLLFNNNGKWEIISSGNTKKSLYQESIIDTRLDTNFGGLATCRCFEPYIYLYIFCRGTLLVIVIIDTKIEKTH